MLTTLTEVLSIAEGQQTAIGSFNTPNFSSVKSVIAAAEALQQPVILMHAQVHEEMGICRMDEIVPLMLYMAQRAEVPVCVHLDHATDLAYLRRGLELGCTSVMYDGSVLAAEENTRNTKLAVAAAKAYDASVEAEIGSMGTREGGGAADPSIYTDPAMAEQFVADTDIDALACAFGTAHGFYQSAPRLDFERLSEIRNRIAVPIVMHGGSGVSPADYREVIRRGVRKINYYTYMAKAGGAAISNREYAQFHDAVNDAEQAMTENVKAAISIFSGRQN